jgi:SagB-type dehydrogenase family enzyme
VRFNVTSNASAKSRRLCIAPAVSVVWQGDAWRLTGARGISRLVPDATLVEVLSAFAQPATADDAAARAPQFARADFDGAVQALVAMDALVEAGAPGDLDVAPHDLAFHVRARAGRIRPLAAAPRPLRPSSSRPSSSTLALPRPDASRSLDVATWHRERRSRRAARPLTLAQLSHALYAAFVDTAGGRPHPSAGALHAIVPHVVVRAGGVPGLSAGGSAGVHRYDAGAHALHHLHDVDAAPLLEGARVAADLAPHDVPAVVVVFVCDLAALHAKYEGIAYALALKETGAMMMSLALGALFAGIDACPLGAGALSLDDAQPPGELVVGEMLLSGRA